jgi:replication factor C large subunit
MWTETYRPKTLGGMIGNEEVRIRLMAWLEKWKPGSKAALLVGPPGTGKTTLAHLLAAKFGLNLVELNASDVRTKEKLTRRIGEAMFSTTLLSERSLIFLDEVDGLAGRSDYGAVEFIKDSIKKSDHPIIMAANDADSEQVRKLASSSVFVLMRPPPPREVQLYLRMISKEEGLDVSDAKLEGIVKSAGGDIRYAINSLQSGVQDSKDVELSAAQSIGAFFDATDSASALKALRAHPGQPRDKLRDLMSGVVRAGLPAKKRALALDALSQADLLVGRINRGRDWRLLRYFDSLLAYELWKVVVGESLQYAQDFLPWPLQVRVWNDSKKLKEIAAGAGPRLGISQKGSLVEDIPYMMVLCSSKKFRDELVRGLNLDETFDAFLTKEAGRAKR